MQSTAPVITVDGPSGSGKGTMASRLSQALKWHFLDSGALYRILGLEVLSQAPALLDRLGNAADAQEEQLHAEQITQLAHHLQIEFKVSSSPGDNDQPTVKAWANGQDVSNHIRTEQVGKAASIVARIPGVRSALLQYQLDARKAPGLVADGRDMGTSIFPNAILKFYLTASAEARAERRFNQLQAAGKNVSLSEVLASIEARDEKDTQRAASPLEPAEDAIIIDSTELDIEAVYSTLEKQLIKKGLLP